MENTFLLEYIEKDSVIHRLNGAAKLICFILWTVAIMLTYDTRFLAALTLLGFVLFKISKIKFNEIKIVFYLISIFLVLNLIMIFLFSLIAHLRTSFTSLLSGKLIIAPWPPGMKTPE